MLVTPVVLVPLIPETEPVEPVNTHPDDPVVVTLGRLVIVPAAEPVPGVARETKKSAEELEVKIPPIEMSTRNKLLSFMAVSPKGQRLIRSLTTQTDALLRLSVKTAKTTYNLSLSQSLPSGRSLGKELIVNFLGIISSKLLQLFIN